jgi:hypothetical protein
MNTEPKIKQAPASLPAPAFIETTPPWMAVVTHKAKNLDFGTIQIVIHDSKVVQIDVTQRHRFDVREHR